jgi:hypothetical protein
LKGHFTVHRQDQGPKSLLVYTFHFVDKNSGQPINGGKFDLTSGNGSSNLKVFFPQQLTSTGTTVQDQVVDGRLQVCVTVTPPGGKTEFTIAPDQGSFDGGNAEVVDVDMQ